MSLLHILMFLSASKVLLNFKIFSTFIELINSPVEQLRSNIAILEMK